MSSVGGASVASSFNFTKAAEMRAATMQRSKANATAAAAPPLQAQALQPGAKAGTVPPATSAAAGTGNLQPGQPQQPAAGMLASLPPAASAPAGTRAGAAARQPAQGNLGDPPGTGALAGKAAAANTHTAAKLAALGAPAGIPGGRGGEHFPFISTRLPWMLHNLDPSMLWPTITNALDGLCKATCSSSSQSVAHSTSIMKSSDVLHATIA